MRLAPTDRPTTTTNGTVNKDGATTTVPHAVIEEPQQVLGMPVTPNNDIYILINNEGITEMYPAEVYPMSSFSNILQVNLSSPFQLCHDMGAHWLHDVLTAGVRVSDRCIINVYLEREGDKM